jgi:hypothetical protein
MSRRGDPAYELEGNREHNQETIASVISHFVGSDMRAHMSAAQRAAAAWYRANGDVERSHTTGVFLKRPLRKGDAPILGVYVDSHSRLTDFTVNREIYLARLHNVGLEVSGIEFLLTRHTTESGAGVRGNAARAAGTGTASSPRPGTRGFSSSGQMPNTIDLPELTDAQRDEIARSTAGLPESLREKVARAMSYSMRRQRYDADRGTNDDHAGAGE